MTNELVLNEIVASWQEHAVAVPSPSLTDIHRRAYVFQQRVRLWKAFQYLMGAIIIVSYATLLFAHPSVRFDIAATLIIAGCLFGMYRMHKERSSRSVPADLGSLTCMEFHRTELLRQRAFLLRSWRYLMLPLPGIAVLMLTQRLNSWLPIGEFVVIFTLMVLGIVTVRRRQARKLQTEIESFDAMAQR
jgi:hypothetical protein